MIKITTSRLFSAFNEQLDHVRSWLQARVPDRVNYKADTLVDCIVQRVVGLSLGPYGKAVLEHLQGNPGTLPPSGTRIDTGRFVLHIGSGAITMTSRHVLASQFEFLVHWTYCLLAIVSGAFHRGSAPRSVLVHNLAEENVFSGGSDEHFIAYCRRGPIDPLRTGMRFFVASPSPTPHVSSDPGVFTYCRHPLMRLLLEARLGRRGRFLLLVRHLALLVEFSWALLRSPTLSLLGRQAAYIRVAEALDDQELIEAVFYTCESWGEQPLWTRSLRHGRVHMIWYSQSPQSASYTYDDEKAVGPLVGWMRVDTHWVWTKGLANYLREHGHGDRDIEIVGPIVWQLPEIGHPHGEALKVVVFDVPAMPNDIMLSFLGEITNYYHPDNLRSFIADVAALKAPLEQALARPVSLAVKMKRGMRPHYDAHYYDFVEELSASGAFIAVTPTDNLYSVISGSDLVIAYPFTSAAYMAEWLGVPAIFYDPTGSVVRDDFCDSEEAICFARGRQELLSGSVALLRQVNRFASSGTLHETAPTGR